MLTEQQLKGIAARAVLATPGAWIMGSTTLYEKHLVPGEKWIAVGKTGETRPNVIALLGLESDENNYEQTVLDALFFTTAREDIAMLIEEVRRFQAFEKRIWEFVAMGHEIRPEDFTELAPTSLPATLETSTGHITTD